MMIRFFGGPYDGLRLDVIAIQRHLVILTVPGRAGPRRFTYLPDPSDWADVVAGRMRVDQSAAFHYYELISTPQGLQFRSDAAGANDQPAVEGGPAQFDGRPHSDGHPGLDGAAS